MRKLKVAVDMDGVLVDIVTPWLKLYNEDYGDTLKKCDIANWDMIKSVKSECGRKIYDYLNVPGIFAFAEKETGADKWFNKLCEISEVMIVTATPKNSLTAFYEKNIWMKRNFPGFNIDNLVSTDNKNLVGADVLIDDGIHNLKQFHGISVCFAQPWNGGLTNANHYDYKANDGNEVIKIIEILSSSDKVFNNCLKKVNLRIKNNK